MKIYEDLAIDSLPEVMSKPLDASAKSGMYEEHGNAPSQLNRSAIWI